MGLEQIQTQLADFHRARRWVVAGDAAAGTTELVNQLRDWEVAGVMVVSATEGVGDLPEGVPIHYTRSRGPTTMKSFRAFFESLRNPSAGLMAALDRFDPNSEALVMAPPFGDLGESMAGRAVYGARPQRWADLEDKMIVDDLWDSAGIARAESEVVSVVEAPRAADRLAGSLGTVWVADNTEGWHGGGDYTRWVSGPAQYGEAAAWFSHRAREVRVMPFLDGLPCSIHGYIASDGVATFRPVEIVVLRTADHTDLIYAGAATLWDPPTEIRDEMRSAAHQVAAELQRRVGYRGPFGIDGICTEDGFLPTELNPRLSAGLGMQTLSAQIPLGSITRCFLAGELELSAQPLEEAIVAGADGKRIGGMGLSVSMEIEPASTMLRFDDSGAEAGADGDDADGTMEVGPSSSGSYIRMRLDTERITPGQPVAPYAVSAVALASELWDFEFPALEAAPDMCHSDGVSDG